MEVVSALLSGQPDQLSPVTNVAWRQRSYDR